MNLQWDYFLIQYKSHTKEKAKKESCDFIAPVEMREIFLAFVQYVQGTHVAGLFRYVALGRVVGVIALVGGIPNQ